jgi:NADP-reducing hydrogenase subunit HndD
MYTALRELGFNMYSIPISAPTSPSWKRPANLWKIFTKRPEEFPLITTCCPSWVDYLEKFHADLIPHFSTAKSPHQMVGTMVKTYWAEKMKLDPKKIFLVSVMPCTAKKYEIERMEDMYASGCKDVDLTITTRELARMLKTRGHRPGSSAGRRCGQPSG